MVIMGCSASEKSYEENMNAAVEQLESDDLEKGEEFLNSALEDKPGDKEATIYLEQTTELTLAEEDFDSGNIPDAKERISNVMVIEDGLYVLTQKAEELQEEIVQLEENYETYQNDYAQAEEYIVDKNFTEASNLLQEIDDNDLTHAYYETLKQDMDDLKIELSKAEQEETDRIKEEERLAEEQAAAEEQEKLKQEQENGEEQENQEQASNSGVGTFEGYWLKDTMACHFTDTYIACALAQSDHITHNEITQVNFLSDTEIELTFEDNVTNTFQLHDENTLNLSGELYHRVSPEEANAIYDGHYTLP